MRVLLLLVAFAALALASDFIPNEYIVQYQRNTPLAVRKLHLTNLTSHPSWSSANNTVLASFEIGWFSGYGVKIQSNDLLDFISAHPSVLRVEHNQRVYKTQNDCHEQAIVVPGLWGKARISSITLPPQFSPYIWPNRGGAGVDAYIIDTGIYIEHDEFYPNRAIAGANFITNEVNTDLNGHGTHVAGTVGGNSFGIAPSCTMIGVKVLDRNGSGTLLGVIQGMEYVGIRRKETQNPSTANMSLGAGLSAAVNDAADALVDTGVVVVVAAGNSNRVSCGFSPASAKQVISVAASDASDIRAYFSNYGGCTDIFAPGVNILSAYIGGRGSQNTLSGTSMAAPHVAGVATGYLAFEPKHTPAEVKSWLNNQASPDQITDAQNTPNRLLYQGCYK